MKHSLKLFILLFILCSCQTTQTQKTPLKKKYSNFNAKVVRKPLKVESDWLGGSERNPVYYTLKGERIYTLDKDVYVFPETVLSVDRLGRVVYPSAGIQLVGDMKVVDYLSLVKAVSRELKGKLPNLRIEADSNFLERPAVIIDLKKKKTLMSFKFEQGQWRRLQ